MKHIVALAFVASLVTVAPQDASAQSGSFDAFGSLSVNELSSSSGSFGGKVALDVLPGVQAFGEFGRMGNVLPPLTTTLASLTPLDVRVTALYGEGGVRLSPAPRSPIRPYLEGSAGVARLNVGVSGLGTTGDVIARTALGFLSRTEPVAGVGGGIVVQGGPLLLDLGYRYKRILADDVFATVLGAGQHLQAHLVRVGVGVRF
jgi:hypothetical protein